MVCFVKFYIMKMKGLLEEVIYMYIRRFILLLLTAVTLAVLVACGGAPGPVEDPLKVSSVSTDIAAHGETVTITGTGLKGATVFLGDFEVVPDSQTGTKIRFAVPGIAPSGPQTLRVRAGEKVSDHPLFIGVDFPSGTLEDLAALNLPPGTAVRLAAHTYTSSGTVQLDNLSLYGVDPTKTILDLALWSDVPEAILALKVEPDANLVIKNLAIHLGGFVVSRLGHDFLPFSMAEDSYELTSVAQLIESQNAGSGSLMFDNVHITDNDSGDEAMLSLAGSDITPVHVSILESSISGKELLAVLIAQGLTIADSEIEGEALIFASAFEDLVVRNSRIEGTGDSSGSSSGLAMEFMTTLGFQFEHAEIVSADNIGLHTSPIIPIQSTTVVKDSSFTVNAPLTGLNGEVFMMHLYAQNATFERVDFNIAGSAWFVVDELTEVTFDASQFVMGDSAFPDDEAVLDFILVDPFYSAVTVTNSTIEFLSEGDVGLLVEGNSGPVHNGSFSFTGNTVTGLAGKSINALYLRIGEVDDEVVFTVTDNEFTGFYKALDIYFDDAGAGFVSGEIRDNVFDFDISAFGDVAVLDGLTDGNIFFDASNNVWGDHTVTADVEALIDYMGSSDASTFNVDPITPAP